MRILLTGFDGQVGWELRCTLAPLGDVITPTLDQVNFTRLDAVREFVRNFRPDVIVNAAAYTAVDAAEKDEPTAKRVNADAPAVLAQEAGRLGALLVHYSTDYVFDGRKQTPYVESDQAVPASAYGRTKLAGETAIRDSGCRHLILRTSWIYGARGKNFLLTMLRLANERDELRVVGDQVGGPTWSRQLAEVTAQLVSAVQRNPQDTRAIYHATCGGQVSWHGFASRIVEQASGLGLCRKVPVRAITTADYPTPATRPAYSVLSNEQLFSDFGLRLPDWERALGLCLEEMGRG